MLQSIPRSKKTNAVQAKGYPDDLTCAFLQFLKEFDRQMPTLVLVDCDPDGLNIFRCYRYGSSRHGSVSNAAARWLGIKTGQTLDMGTATCEASPDPLRSSLTDSLSSKTSSGLQHTLVSTSNREPVTMLSARDRKLAMATLERLEIDRIDDDETEVLKRELQIMLHLGVKTEIQWLDESGSLVGWLDHQLREAVL